MKKPFYKLAYRAVSWLSDRSGGASLFVKWKVALSVIIIGLSATTLTGCNKPEEVTCYEPVIDHPTCYQPNIDQEYEADELSEVDQDSVNAVSQLNINE